MEVCKRSRIQMCLSTCLFQRTSIMFVLLTTVWSTILAVEATGDRRRADQLWKATQALQIELEELKATNAMLQREIAQIEEDGERLDRKMNLLISQEGPLKDELAIVKNAVIGALATVETVPLMQRLLHTRLRWMGEVDKDEFAQAYKVALDAQNPSHRYNIHLSHADNMLRIYKAVCVKLVRSQLWEPFRVDPEKEEFVLRMVDPIRERLREVWGETICDLVLVAKRELLDYNPSGAYSVPMPWDPVVRRVVKHSDVIKQFGFTVVKCNRLIQNCRCSHSTPPPPLRAPFSESGSSHADDPPVVAEDEDSVIGEGFELGPPDALGFENWPLAPPNSPVSTNGPRQGSAPDEYSGGRSEPTYSDPPPDMEYDPPEETEEYLYILIG